jgi:hypothetical protein
VAIAAAFITIPTEGRPTLALSFLTLSFTLVLILGAISGRVPVLSTIVAAALESFSFSFAVPFAFALLHGHDVRLLPPVLPEGLALVLVARVAVHQLPGLAHAALELLPF